MRDEGCPGALSYARNSRDFRDFRFVLLVGYFYLKMERDPLRWLHRSPLQALANNEKIPSHRGGSYRQRENVSWSCFWGFPPLCRKKIALR